jgi:hypothetical protein
MAIGDSIGIAQSLAAGATLDIKPATDIEWVVQNIMWEGAPIELLLTDGTTALKLETDQTSGGRFGLVFRCTTSLWYQVKNTSSGAIKVGYTGVQTKGV